MFFKPTKVIREYSLVYLFAVINCYQYIKVSVNENFSTLLDFVFLDFWHE